LLAETALLSFSSGKTESSPETLALTARRADKPEK
jgi:hypothetical protein